MTDSIGTYSVDRCVPREVIEAAIERAKQHGAPTDEVWRLLNGDVVLLTLHVLKPVGRDAPPR